MARQLVLCVDDERDILDLHMLVLERAGYSVLGACDAPQALNLLSANAVDVVIADHLLPGCSGSDMVKEMKRLKPNVPIIMLSGMFEMQEAEHAADVFLSKPNSSEDLIKVVGDLLAPGKSAKREQAG
jgi:CheY-like chemotaxis protein